MAGTSYTTLATAMADDLERQLRLIRNRMIGGDESEERESVVNDGKKGITVHEVDYLRRSAAWINAEGDYRKMNGKANMAGYRMNSWGGTL